MILPFGKHRGKSLCEVPRSYLRWLDSQTWFHDEHPFLADDIRRFLGTSSDANPEPESQQQTPMLVADTLKSWRRTVLAKWHPDRPGGSHSAFLAVNDAVQTLVSMLAATGAPA